MIPSVKKKKSKSYAYWFSNAGLTTFFFLLGLMFYDQIWWRKPTRYASYIWQKKSTQIIGNFHLRNTKHISCYADAFCKRRYRKQGKIKESLPSSSATYSNCFHKQELSLRILSTSTWKIKLAQGNSHKFSCKDWNGRSSYFQVRRSITARLASK